MLRVYPAWICFIFSFFVGSSYGVFLLGTDFLITSSDYWQLPTGHSGGLIDTRLMLSSYFWFVQDEWRWPLFHITQVNGSSGANAALIDPVPAVLLVAKLLRNPFGPVNLYPVWITSCFGLNAAALTALTRGLGARSALSAVLASALGAMAPVTHFRFGHIPLEAHWVFVLALAIYAMWDAGRLRTLLALAGMVALCLLVFAINLYIYVMTAAIAASWVLQAGLRRELRVAMVSVGLSGVLLAGLIPFWAFGLGAATGIGAETAPFGYASMNILSPFWPQTSGLGSLTGLYGLTRGSIGATAGQYEGYCYLGGGILILALASLIRIRHIPNLNLTLVYRNWVLLLALTVLTFWALSNTIYAGSFKVLSYPLPEFLLHSVLAWFRSSGRFFWPVAWLLAACSIAGAMASYNSRAAFALAVAAIFLQVVDLAPWRARLRLIVDQTPVTAFRTVAESRNVEGEIKRRGRAVVAPPLLCAAAGSYDSVQAIAGVEMQLMAARSNAEMPTIVMSRNSVDCALVRKTPLQELAGNGLMLVLEEAPHLDRRMEAKRELSCREVPAGLLCVRRPDLVQAAP